MTPLDRAALADALASATAETLRRIAEEHHAVAITLDEFDDPSAAFKAQANDHRIVAALALACADLEENGRSVLFGITKTGRVVLIDEDGAGYTAKGDTLPRALAALLKGDQ